MAGDIGGRKSTLRYVYTLGGTIVSWVSKLHKIITFSTTEVEYVSATEASKEIIWLQLFLEKLNHKQRKSVLHCDSQSAIYFVRNHMFNVRIKHIQV